MPIFHSLSYYVIYIATELDVTIFFDGKYNNGKMYKIKNKKLRFLFIILFSGFLSLSLSLSLFFSLYFSFFLFL